MGRLFVAAHDLRIFPIIGLKVSHKFSISCRQSRFDRTKAWRRIASPDLDLETMESESKTLIGRYNGPHQGKLPGAVALYEMSWSYFFERWLCCCANLLGILATRMEVTTGGWIGGIGN